MTHDPAHLHKLLLVGTARARTGVGGLAPELAAVVGPALGSPAVTPERQLWLAIGAQRLWTRAGHAPPPMPAARHAASAPEQMPACPRAAEAILRSLLAEREAPPAESIVKDLLGQSVASPLLLQWLQLLNGLEARLPARFLPNMLARATREPALRPGVLEALGTRGRWLSQCEPAWSWANAPGDTGHVQNMWQNGARKERVAALEAWRRSAPDAARAALQSCWAAEPPDERAAFLPCLGIHLGAEDEPFLEAALDDRRKAVRVVAQRLLARLPGSALSQRMLARVLPLLQLEGRMLGGATLAVSLPHQCDAAMVRDGVGEGKYPGLGEKAGWLADMLGAVAPSIWSTRFGLSPGQCFALASGSDYHEALVRGWTAAVELHLNQAVTSGLLAWLKAWTRRWIEAEGRRFHSGAPPFTDAYLALPTPDLHAALLGLVQASGTTWTDKDIPLLELLQHLAPEARTGWPAALSREIARRLLGGLPALLSHQWALGWGVKVLAVVLDPGAVLEAAGQYPVPQPDAPAWQALLDPFFHVVRFRHEMILSFQEPA